MPSTMMYSLQALCMGETARHRAEWVIYSQLGISKHTMGTETEKADESLLLAPDMSGR